MDLPAYRRPWQAREYKLERALKRARREIAAQQRCMIADATLHDSKGKPRMETLDKLARPDIARRQRVLDAIDRVLKS
jgi:hypothetical protein